MKKGDHMTPDELRAALERAALSQVKGAEAVGIDPRTMRRYVAGDAAIPKAVELAVKHLAGAKRK